MKLNKIWIIGLAATLSACNNKDKQHDATGIFEATEINIAARNTGELVQFDIEEGQNVEAGIQLGYIDTTQLHLKKLQLLANLKAVGSRHYNVCRPEICLQFFVYNPTIVLHLIFIFVLSY